MLQVSKVLQAYLGGCYVPERDWTSNLRNRSGFQPFRGPVSCAAFTLSDSKTADQMTTFVTEFGRSQVHRWGEVLQANSPIYHIDVVVNRGTKGQPFVIGSSQVERVRLYFWLKLVYLLSYVT